MNCIFCQNYEISQAGKGLEITTDRLANIMLEQQARGVNNINLVTPTMYIYQIIEAIDIARKGGLKIPIVYNTNTYESLETIKMLKGYVDIYLPDLKYADNDLAVKYSSAPNYFEVATANILEMINQVGEAQFDNSNSEEPIMKKGVIVRHLVLPGQIENSKCVMDWFNSNCKDKAYFSLMAQYFPCYKAKEDPALNRKLTNEEYSEVENYLYDLNIENGYMQDLGEHEEEFVPEFDFRNVKKSED